MNWQTILPAFKNKAWHNKGLVSTRNAAQEH
jgi:hypothetical protein